MRTKATACESSQGVPKGAPRLTRKTPHTWMVITGSIGEEIRGRKRGQG